MAFTVIIRVRGESEEWRAGQQNANKRRIVLWMQKENYGFWKCRMASDFKGKGQICASEWWRHSAIVDEWWARHPNKHDSGEADHQTRRHLSSASLSARKNSRVGVCTWLEFILTPSQLAVRLCVRELRHLTERAPSVFIKVAAFLKPKPH